MLKTALKGRLKYPNIELFRRRLQIGVLNNSIFTSRI